MESAIHASWLDVQDFMSCKLKLHTTVFDDEGHVGGDTMCVISTRESKGKRDGKTQELEKQCLSG